MNNNKNEIIDVMLRRKRLYIGLPNGTEENSSDLGEIQKGINVLHELGYTLSIDLYKAVISANGVLNTTYF